MTYIPYPSLTSPVTPPPLLVLIRPGGPPCLFILTNTKQGVSISGTLDLCIYYFSHLAFSLSKYFHGLPPHFIFISIQMSPYQKGQIGRILLPCTITLFPSTLLYFLTELTSTTITYFYHVPLP